MKIPLLWMEIILVDRKFSYSLEGLEEAPLFLFYIRQNKLNIPENSIFSREAVTEKILTEYQEQHFGKSWEETLKQYQEASQEDLVLSKRMN